MNWYDDDQSPEKEDQAFQQAMNLTGTEFMDVSFNNPFEFICFLTNDSF